MIKIDSGEKPGYDSPVIRSFKYRLQPNHTQRRALDSWLPLTRELYNAGLQERRDAWKKQRVSLSAYDQMAELPAVREGREDVAAVPVVVLRGALRRLDRAFHGFFRRCKTGERPGYPRFRGRDRWNTIEIDDLGGRNPLTPDGRRVRLPFIGPVKLELHRPIEGTPKAMRLTRDAADRWYVVLCCVDVPARPLPRSERDVGVDVGLLHFAATSDGGFFANPRPLKAAQAKLRRAARRLARRKKGSHRRRVAARNLARHHEHVANVRREHHIGVARSLVHRHGTIFVEDLNVKGLARGRLAGSVNDAAWSGFLHWLRVKAEEAGREVVEVDPRGTSQVCSGCGIVVQKDLGVRVHRCPDCGLTVDRDVNAARNILALGRSARRAVPDARAPRRPAKISRTSDRITPSRSQS